MFLEMPGHEAATYIIILFFSQSWGGICLFLVTKILLAWFHVWKGLMEETQNQTASYSWFLIFKSPGKQDHSSEFEWKQINHESTT